MRPGTSCSEKPREDHGCSVGLLQPLSNMFQRFYETRVRCLLIQQKHLNLKEASWSSEAGPRSFSPFLLLSIISSLLRLQELSRKNWVPTHFHGWDPCREEALHACDVAAKNLRQWLLSYNTTLQLLEFASVTYTKATKCCKERRSLQQGGLTHRHSGSWEAPLPRWITPKTPEKVPHHALNRRTYQHVHN